MSLVPPFQLPEASFIKTIFVPMAEYLYAGTSMLILFISLLIITKKRKALSDYIFLIWLFILFVNVVTFIVFARFGYPDFFTGKILIEITEASIFLHGPLFLFYTRSLSAPDFRLRSRHVLHIIPFAVCLLILILGILLSGEVDATTRNAFTITKMASLLLYTLAIIVLLNRHRSQVEKVFSNTENKYLNWLKFLAWGIVVVWIISTAGLILYNLSYFNNPQQGALLGNLAFCFFIFLIGFFGVKQEAIFSFSGNSEDSILPRDKVRVNSSENIENALIAEVILTAETIPEPVVNDKYKNSGLSIEKSLELFTALEDFMQKSKPYQNPELTLFSLAKQLSIHPNHLSQIINQHHKQNFFDYVNEYRVKDVKEALLSGKYDNHSLLGVAFECGFNSKASFNRAFKKNAGVTPSEFRKKQVPDLL